MPPVPAQPQARRPRAAVLVAAALALLAFAALLSGCGPRDGDAGGPPAIGDKDDSEQSAAALGFPVFATKNTTRVSGKDPTADAAGAALAVHTNPAARPAAVALVDSDDWRAGIAASLLGSEPIDAPVLLTDGQDLPDTTRDAIGRLAPEGVERLRGAQALLVGDAAQPPGLRGQRIEGDDPFALAAAIDVAHARASGRPADTVVIASAESPEFAMPAAAWAAKGATPVLYVTRNSAPAETLRALRLHQQPRIYLLGPPSLISQRVARVLARLGTVKRIAGPDPVTNAIAFARYADGAFGWGVVDPGHGFVFANASRHLDAAAGAPLSSSGKYGPLLLVEEAGELPVAVENYLLDVQPGYSRDPVRGVYNHAWLMGDESAISSDVQTRIDSLLEIAPVQIAPAGQGS